MSPTCVHCVVTRAATRFGRRYARPFTLSSCSTQAPLVAMDGPELYALVSHFFRDAAESPAGDGAVRIRIVSDVHPEVQILATTGAKRAARVRTLAVARHADGSLMGGFGEFYGADDALAPDAVGA
jgi:hypothetical protein